MPVVTGRLDAPAQTEALLQQGERAPLRLLVGVVFANQDFDLLGKQPADRGIALRGENLWPCAMLQANRA